TLDDSRDASILPVGVTLDAQVRGISHGLEAEAASPDLRLDEAVPGIAVGVDGNVDVGRDRPADAAVNADDAAFQVEQRAARVAAHQGAVGAKDRLIGLQNAAQADDGRAARTEPARMAGPDAPLPFLQIR